ncbi:MAG TPA: alanine racemase [Roseiflexaceae bacterium]|nr:alanine racemase [Roseiflexaceae bacterium]
MSSIERIRRHGATKSGARIVPLGGRVENPTCARIDLAAITENVRRLRAHAGVPLIAVAKADAYGHGMALAARGLLAGGAAMIAVANLDEAAVLRAAGIAAPIMLLGFLPPQQARDALRLDVTCTIYDQSVADGLIEATRATGRSAQVHLEVDTGMGRLGLTPADVGPLLRRLADVARIRVTGMYTHFACADELDASPALAQLARFKMLLAQIEAAGLRPPLVHAANSAALLRFPEARFDAVRPGIACYGLTPAPHVPLIDGLRPALMLESTIAQLKEVPIGTPLSYGGMFVTTRPTMVATVPIGYADGVQRSPAWRSVLIGGQRAPVIGRICMDYILVDVTDIAGVTGGDQVVLIGEQGAERIDAAEVAGWLGTITHEVLTTIGPRVRRAEG